MKEKTTTILKKTLASIASLSCESASFLCLYEPKLPEQLLKKNKKSKNTMKKNV